MVAYFLFPAFVEAQIFLEVNASGMDEEARSENGDKALEGLRFGRLSNDSFCPTL